MITSDQSPSSGGLFPQTHWSVVLHPSPTGSPEAQHALEKLCRAYWYPLYAFVRGTGPGHHETEDLVQGYFAGLLSRSYLKRADPARGRFRSFLLTDLKFFIANEWQKEAADKRGKDKVVSWEGLMEGAEDRFLREPASPDHSPDKLFEQSFTMQLIQQTLDTLKSDSPDAESQTRFDVLAKLLAGKNPEMSQQKAADQLGISEEAVGKAVFDLRKRFSKVFRETISQTVTNYEDLDDEIQYHLNTFSR